MRYLLYVMGLAAALAATAPAAEPEALSPDQAFQQLRVYDYGQSDKALRAIELHVVRYATDAAKKAEMAERFGAILTDAKTSQAAKVFACQQLLVVGTEAQVPVLARMLDDPQTAEIARFTLQAIPGEASLVAIRSAAEKLQGKPLVGAINSLGIRRDTQAVRLLAKHLSGGDPLVAGAAAEALGKIGTEEAAAVLMKAELPKAAAALHNAQLQCAERLIAAGNVVTAAELYQSVCLSKRSMAWRIAGLAGLVKADQARVTPIVLEALSAQDALLQATAVRLARELPGPQVTAALASRLAKVDPSARVLLLGVLAERGDRSAAEAVAARIDDPDAAVRVAAIQAMGRLGDAAAAERLAKLASASSGGVQQAARNSLARLTGPEIEPKLQALAAQGEPGFRIEALRALAARRSTSSAPVLLKVAADADPQVRLAALDALGVVVDGASYPKLVQFLVAAPTPGDAETAERAVLAAGGRLATVAEQTAPLLALLGAAPAQAKPSLLRVLGGFGGPEALEAVRARLADPEEKVRDAAVRSAAGWPDASAAPDLLKIAQSAESNTHRLLALRGYLRLSGEVKDEAARLKMLEQVRPIAKTADAKRMLLSALAETADPGALHVAASLLDDAEVRAEAAAAVLKLGKALARLDPSTVRGAMKRLLDTTKDRALAEQAEAIDEEAMRAPSPAAAQQALQYDKKRSDAQKAVLAKRPPQGFRLACYLDCGPDTADGVKGGPLLRLVSGGPYFWPESLAAADVRFGTVAFDSQRVVFEVQGLNPKRAYQLGFTWWDYDHDSRVQSVWLSTGKGDRPTKLLDKTKLPSGANKQSPDGKTLPIPADLYADGTLRITFCNESEPNAAVSEVWLWESEAERK